MLVTLEQHTIDTYVISIDGLEFFVTNEECEELTHEELSALESLVEKANE